MQHSTLHAPLVYTAHTVYRSTAAAHCHTSLTLYLGVNCVHSIYNTVVIGKLAGISGEFKPRVGAMQFMLNSILHERPQWVVLQRVLRDSFCTQV